MKETIKKNLFVMTRDRVKDYDWICKPTDFNVSKLLAEFDETYFKILRKSGNDTFTSEWYRTQLGENQIVFRIIVDGRIDVYGRTIRRYEGSSFPDITHQNISILEDCLREIQEKTNNYGYGDFLPKEKEVVCKREKVENCTVEIKDNKIVIKSNILDQFLKDHTYEELLTLLQVDPNSIDREER